MMEKNNQKAIGFIFLLFLTMTYKEMVWDPYFLGTATPPMIPAAEPGQVPQQGQPPINPGPTNSTLPPSQLPQPPLQSPPNGASVAGSVPSDVQIAEAGLLPLENSAISVQIALLGGRVAEYRLKNYLEHLEPKSPKLNLVDHADGKPLPLGIYSGPVDDAWVKYQNTSTEQNVLKLTGTLPDGRQITKEIKLSGQPERDYLLNVSVQLSAPPADGAPLLIEWARYFAKDSASFLDSQNTGGFVWFDGQAAHRQAFNHSNATVQDLGAIVWASITDHYFVTSLLSPSAPGLARAVHEGDLYRIQLAGKANQGDFQVLGGPKSYNVLRGTGYALERNIDFGWTGFLAAPLLTLLNMFHSVLGNYGLSIIALTICVRLLLLPLNAASFKSMKAMQELQPEMKKIKETIKDKRQQQLAQHELFTKKGVSPLGGCLPIAVQIPIFFGLYSALLLAIELRHAPFAVWIHDLSAPEGIHMGETLIPILVVVFVLTMLYQQWSTPSTMDETQKKLMLIMPIVFGFVFFRKMPAGLILYWVTSNIISIVQMRQLRKEGRHSPFLITAGVAMLCFAVAFVLTKVT